MKNPSNGNETAGSDSGIRTPPEALVEKVDFEVNAVVETNVGSSSLDPGFRSPSKAASISRAKERVFRRPLSRRDDGVAVSSVEKRIFLLRQRRNIASSWNHSRLAIGEILKRNGPTSCPPLRFDAVTGAVEDPPHSRSNLDSYHSLKCGDVISECFAKLRK
jgi:hypothetical protein